ncbi:MAG: DUF4153 domain-containing protein [Anaerolineales bacterium]
MKDPGVPPTDTGTARAGSYLPKRPLQLTGAAMLLGIAVDVLFDRHAPGISFLIWAALSAGALLIGARWEGVRPDRSALLLIPAILFFSAMIAVRLEPLTVALSLLSTLLLFGLCVRTLRAGRLLRFGWLDFGAAWITVPLESLVRLWPTLGVATRTVAGDRATRSRGAAVLRGLLLALPVLIVLVALLTAADFVFRDLVENLLTWLDIEWIRETIGRSLVIGLSGLFSLGALVTALRDRAPRELMGEQQPLLKPFLGFIETAVVLGAVDLVFAVFVAIQFAYLFGGEANITAAGYTYSEYARRGFGELVWAAFLSLGLILALAHLSRREAARQRTTFNALGAGLIAMLGVTLASGLMRLLLYENAYGFTRLRTYTHVFIFWLAALLVVFALLLLRERLRMLAPASVVAGFGFVATLGLINVDGFIADRNLVRLQASGELDVVYLAQLTGDAIPTLAGGLSEASPPELLAYLACQEAIRTEQQSDMGWQSWHWGRFAAARALDGVGDRLSRYALDREDAGWMVAGPGVQATPCLGQWLD